MPQQPFILGVDVDGVLGDYATALRPVAAEHLGVDPATLPDDYSWDFSEWGIDGRDTFMAIHRKAVMKHSIFRTMAVLPGAAAALREISDAGVYIKIVTHRLCFNFGHHQSIADTAWWFDNVAEIPYRDILFTADKSTVVAGLDMMIDDAPHNITAMREAAVRQNLDCMVVTMDQPYNRTLPGPRVTNWDQMKRLVLAQKQLREIRRNRLTTAH
jgi:5'-nucleotidase